MGGAIPKSLPVHLKQVLVILSPEGTTQVVGFLGAKASDVYRQLVHLILEQNYPLGSCQRALFQFVVEAPGDAIDMPLNELADAVVNSHPRPNGGDFAGHLR